MKDLFEESKTDIVFKTSSLLMFGSIFAFLFFNGFVYLISGIFPEKHIITTVSLIIFAIIMFFLLSYVLVILPLSYITNFVILFIKLFSKNKTKKDYIIIAIDIILLVVFAIAIAAEIVLFCALEILSEV